LDRPISFLAEIWYDFTLINSISTRSAADIQGMTASGRFCSLIPGLGVKLSTNILAGSTVLSAVGACPPHDGARRRWRINVESAVAPFLSARKKSDDLTDATVPAGTSLPAVSREPMIS
jgi:hypothetical protein